MMNNLGMSLVEAPRPSTTKPEEQIIINKELSKKEKEAGNKVIVHFDARFAFLQGASKQPLIKLTANK